MTDLVSLLVQQEKLAVLGVADPRLAPSWGDSPSLAAGTLAVTVSGSAKAPFGGFVQASPQVTLTDAAGTAVASGGTVVAMHPAAYLGLCRLYVKLQDAVSTTLARPVPRYLHLAGGNGAPTGAVRPADAIGTGVTLTFHDARGLIVDAGAVAACFTALQTLYPDLSTGSAADLTSGLTALVGSGTAIVVAASTPHGGPWRDPGEGKGVGLATSGSSTVSNRLGASPVTLTSRDDVQVHVEDSAGLVRAGLYPSGLLGSSDVALPGLASGVTLNRDFFRVVCVDLASYLPGPRTADVVDAHTAAEPAPLVRDGITVTTMLDGVDTLRVAASVLASAGSGGEAWLASPDVTTVRLPGAGSTTSTSADVHWPTHPAWPTSTTPAAWGTAGTGALRAAGAVTVTWAESGSVDVYVTIAAGALPPGAFVRVYPRRMVFPDTLADGPSIVRGDGAATIAPDTSTACVLRLADPLALGASPRPSGANLTFDLLVVPRPPTGAPQPRLLGGFAVAIGDTASPAPAPTAPTDFDEADGFGAVPVANRAVSHSGILGFARSSDPFGGLSWPTSASQVGGFLAALAESLGDEGTTTQPRDAPRLPTMARRETLVAARSGAGGGTQTWQSLVGGGWLTPRTRTADPRQGGPGWPAQAETDTTAVSVDGPLAYDAALAALRRTTGLVGRMKPLNDDTAWTAPTATPSTTQRWAGAVLQTVAAYCETPDLALIPDPSVLPDGSGSSSWSSVLAQLPDAVKSAFGSVVPTSPRAFAELRREAYAAKYGRRDAQVALRRAIDEARELVYIEASRFGASSNSDGAPQTDESPATEDTLAEWDVVAKLVARLAAVPTLRVVLCLPKLPDYPTQYEAFAAYEYKARQDALTKLTAAGGDRVVLLHPMGFPGRPLHTGTTIVCVDDVWLLVGTSSPTRRGLTFDGASDVVLFDRQLDEGYSSGIRAFRRSLLGRLMGASAPTTGQTPTATWVKLAQPAPAAMAIRELVTTEAGNGLVEGIYTPTPTAGHGTPAAASLADPDGRNVDLLVLAGQAMLRGLEMLPPA